MCFILSDCRQLAASCPSSPAAREDKQAQADNSSFQGRRSPSLELSGGPLSAGETRMCHLALDEELRLGEGDTLWGDRATPEVPHPEAGRAPLPAAHTSLPILSGAGQPPG